MAKKTAKKKVRKPKRKRRPGRRPRERRGPRGGKPRTSADGSRVQLNIYLHKKLVRLLDDDRCHISRRAWLETVLCGHFDISEREIA